MEKDEILDLYTERYNFLAEAAKDLKSDLTNTFDNIPRTRNSY